jgi:hypothetical protein
LFCSFSLGFLTLQETMNMAKRAPLKRTTALTPVRNTEPTATLPTNDDAAYQADVAQGKRIVAQMSQKQWQLGDLADKVEKAYGENRLERFAEDIHFDGVASTLERYRDVCRAFPKTRGRPRFFASAQVLAPHPSRLEIVEREPGISERDARAIMRQWRDEQDQRAPTPPAAAGANLTETLNQTEATAASEDSATPPIATEEAQSAETEPDDADVDDDDQSEPDVGSAEWHTRRWWREFLILERSAASYGVTPQYAPDVLLLAVVQPERLPRMEARFEAVLNIVRHLRSLFDNRAAAE